MIDVQRARRDTPGCERVLHFNNAGAALMPGPVLDTVIGHLRREADIGGYEAAEEAADRLEAVYESAAALLNCRPDEVAVVENATRAWDMAFYSLGLAAGDRILCSEAEYASNFIAFLQVAQRTGAVIDVVPSDAHGQIDVEALADAVGPDVRLIALTHVPTNGGLVNPAADVGQVAREHGIPYLLDACQSVGQLPVDVADIGCDMLSGTSRKYLRGPRGAGFLYVRRALLDDLEPVLLDLHAAEWTGRHRYRVRPDSRRFETWEGNVAAKLGLGAAIDYARRQRIDAIAYWVGTLADRLRDRLDDVSGVTVRDLGAERCGIVSFTVDGVPAEQVKDALRRDAINVSTTTRAATLLDMQRRGLETMVRASVHYYNTEAEVERFCAAVAAVHGRPRLA